MLIASRPHPLHPPELFAPSAAALLAPSILTDLSLLHSNALSLPTPTLQLLVLSDLRLPRKRRLATATLQSLLRALRFLALALRASLAHPDEELSQSFTRAWEGYYARCFTWMVRPLFKLLIRACPGREEVWGRLGGEGGEACEEWLRGLEERVERVEEWMEGGGYGVL